MKNKILFVAIFFLSAPLFAGNVSLICKNFDGKEVVNLELIVDHDLLSQPGIDLKRFKGKDFTFQVEEWRFSHLKYIFLILPVEVNELTSKNKKYSSLVTVDVKNNGFELRADLVLKEHDDDYWQGFVLKIQDFFEPSFQIGGKTSITVTRNRDRFGYRHLFFAELANEEEGDSEIEKLLCVNL